MTTKSSTMVITPEEWAHEEAQQAARPIKKYDTFYCNGQRWTFNNKIIKKEGQQDDDGWVWNGRLVLVSASVCLARHCFLCVHVPFLTPTLTPHTRVQGGVESGVVVAGRLGLGRGRAQQAREIA